MKILLVDDTDDMRRLVELFLKMLHHEVESAEDGSDGFEKFKQNSYDVVLMDMRMPIMDGYEATRAIRQWEKSEAREPTVIIALTSFSTQEEIAKSIDAGCDTHLVKPISKDSLSRALDNLPAPTVHEYSENKASEGQAIQVTIDPDLEDLVPGYMEKRKKDLVLFENHLEDQNFEEIRSMGHKIKGSGGGYGFTGLSKIGADIENAAKASDGDIIAQKIEEYRNYIENVHIVYAEEE